MAFPELTLTVQSDRRVQALAGDGAQAFGDFALTDLDTNLVNLFADWLVQKKVTARREIELFGTLMYRALINDNVHTLIEQMLSQKPAGERLRLQLSFQKEVADFAGLPWEFLYRPDTETRAGFFLATDNDLVFSRYIPLQTGRAATLKPDKPPLRMLVAITPVAEVNPTAVQPIIEAIEKLAEQVPLDLHILEKPTRDDLLDTLLDFRPHVFHFITQRRFDKDKQQGHIALVKPDSVTADWIDDRSFADFFEILKGNTRLVFLQHCESGTTNQRADFAELAPQLIRNSVQAVITMQYPITNLGAVTFSTRFYRALMRGDPVDHAVQSSRWRIQMAADEKAISLRDFGTPVLTMRSHNGVIQPEAKPMLSEALDVPITSPGDAFSPYENGIRALLARLGQQHVRHSEALVYQQRLLENITLSRLYGNTDNRNAERAEVIARLNALSMSELHVPFNELCVTGP